GRGAVAQRRVARAAGPQLGHDVVLGEVDLHERVDVGVGLRVDPGDELVDAPGVDAHAEANLGLGLVALGDGDIAHVVAETRDLHALRGLPPGCRARPGADLGGDGGVARVPHDRLPRHRHAAEDVAVLAVAVGGLVE